LNFATLSKDLFPIFMLCLCPAFWHLDTNISLRTASKHDCITELRVNTYLQFHTAESFVRCQQSSLLSNWPTDQPTPWRYNLKVHHRTHIISPPPVPILRQLNQLHIPQTNLPKIHSDPVLPSTPRSPEWSLSFGISHQNLVHFTLLSYACHIPRLPHSHPLPN
jgi:hypothetical protein